MCYKNYCFIVLLFICLSVTNTFSQVSIATPEQVEKFYKTTTCIVKDSKPFSFLNAYLKDAVENSWKVTKYKIIEENDFESLRQRTDLSFIILSEAEYTEHKQLVKLDVLNIVLGNKGKGLDDMPDLGSVPLAYTDNDEISYLYKIPAIVKLIQYQINVIKQNKISSPQELMDYHNKWNKEIKSKELWLLEGEISPEINTLEKIRKIYPYNVKIKSKDELEEAIKAGKDILFLHLVAPFEEGQTGKCWKFIISALDGKVYYVDNHDVKDPKENGLIQKDFKKFAQ